MQPRRIDILDLVDNSEDLCISIFMPTHEAQIEQQKADVVQLRNLIDEARVSIREFSTSLNNLDIERILEPATQILEMNGDFWKQQRGGLAIFLSEGFNRLFSISVAVAPQVVVSDHFYFRPIIAYSANYNRFYILALSKKQVRLFLATESIMEELELKKGPKSLDDILDTVSLEKDLQFHGGANTRGPTGKGTPVYYSHGIRKTSEKDLLLDYCRQVDAGLKNYLHNETAPLVLACVDYLFAIYKKANTYPHLFPYCVSGSPDRLSQTVIHDKALKIVPPEYNQSRQTAIDDLFRLIGQGQVLADVNSIVPAAFQGRVDKLFLVEDCQKHGRFDEAAGSVELFDRTQPGCQELMNLAAIYTLANDGEVYALRPDAAPEGIEIAATLRYKKPPFISISKTVFL